MNFYNFILKANPADKQPLIYKISILLEFLPRNMKFKESSISYPCGQIPVHLGFFKMWFLKNKRGFSPLKLYLLYVPYFGGGGTRHDTLGDTTFPSMA